jgi:cytochrome b subunit of formate dehydrogenase
VSWREGATFVHDTFSYAIVAVIVGHIYMALTHRGSLQSMLRGWVSERWAAVHAAGWMKELRVADPPSMGEGTILRDRSLEGPREVNP